MSSVKQRKPRRPRAVPLEAQQPAKAEPEPCARAARLAAKMLDASTGVVAVRRGSSAVHACWPEARSDARAGDVLLAVDSVTVVRDVRQRDAGPLSEYLRSTGLGSALCVPLTAPDGTRHGVVAVGSEHPRDWSAEDVQALEDLAVLLAPAVERGEAGAPDEPPAEPLAALERLRRSFHDALAGQAVATPTGRILACNPEFARITGFASVEEAMAANLHSLELEPGAFVALLRRLREQPLIPLEELRFMRRDGTPERVLARLVATLNDDGAVEEVRVCLVDITRHHQLERKLRARSKRLRSIERATQDVLWDWNLVTGRVSWSAVVARRFRYTHEEVRPTVEWHLERIHPADRERVLAGIERAIAGVETSWRDEYRFLRGDGTYATVLDRAHVLRNGRGEPVRMVGWILDVTERKASEDAQRFLARASAELEEALEVNASCAALARLCVPALSDFALVDVLESDGSLRRAGVAHVESARDVFLGLGTTLPPGTETSVSAPLAACRSGDSEFRPCAPDDGQQRLGVSEEVVVRAYMTVPIVARSGALGALTLGITDGARHWSALDLMTAKELARRAGLALTNCTLYETARRAVLARNEVIGLVSHDLRVPVNTIVGVRGLLETILGPDDPNVGRWLDVLRRATNHMSALIDNLLDASRMESQEFVLKREYENPAVIISQACEMLRSEAASKGIVLKTTVPEDLPAVAMDAPQVARVISNLVGNAIKFSPAGSSVRVDGRMQGEELLVSVADEGEGIPESHLPHVFDRFWKGRLGDSAGAGLGLTIARGIVEAHGGHIRVESQPGSGSTFTFALPISAAPP